jgi:Rieske 2Fe-2S family protein
VAPYASESLVLADRHTYEVAANWKVVAENYHECYHCPLIHPELCQVSPPDSGENYDLPGAWVGGSMVLRDGMATMSLTGERAATPLPGVDPERVEYVHLLPNLLVSAHPDYVMTHRLVPLAPGRTWIECSWLVAPDFWAGRVGATRPRRSGLLGRDQPAGLGGVRVACSAASRRRAGGRSR